VIADQLIKYVVTARTLLHQSIVLFPGFLSITHIRNSGAAFSMFSGHNAILALIGITFIVFIGYYLPRLARKSLWGGLSVALIMAGALGNLIDRMMRGYVIDYIDVKWFSIFNLADVYINIGVALLILLLIFDRRKQTSTKG